jgi:capsular polysaccharide biosynthesis protein
MREIKTMTKTQGDDQALSKRESQVSKNTGITAPHVPPYGYAAYEPYEEEVDLLELLDTLWQRKWIVVLTALVCVGAAVAYLFTATPQYRISMQVRPGITAYDKDGPIRGWTPDDIASWINNEQYRIFFPVELLSKEEEEIPEVKGQKARESNNITLTLLYPDPETGKKILERLYGNTVDYYANKGGDPQIQLTRLGFEKQIQELLDNKYRIEKIVAQELESSIKEHKDQIQLHQEEIEKVSKKKATDVKTLQELERRMQATLTNTSDLVKLRDQMIARKEPKDLSLLLYTNIIQQNIYHVSQLQERIAHLEKVILEAEKTEKEIEKRIRDTSRDIVKIETTINEDLRLQKQDIDRRIERLRQQIKALTPMERVSGPLASLKPVKPKKLLVIALAMVVGGFMGIAAAFLAHAYARRKEASAQQQ